MGWRHQTQETIKADQVFQQKRIESMKLKHSEKMTTDIAQLTSEQYRKDCIHTKVVVSMENELETRQKSNT